MFLFMVMFKHHLLEVLTRSLVLYFFILGQWFIWEIVSMESRSIIVLKTLFIPCILVLATVAEGSPAEPDDNINTDMLLEARRETTAQILQKNYKCWHGPDCGYFYGVSIYTFFKHCDPNPNITRCCAEPCTYDSTAKDICVLAFTAYITVGNGFQGTFMGLLRITNDTLLPQRLKWSFP